MEYLDLLEQRLVIGNAVDAAAFAPDSTGVQHVDHPFREEEFEQRFCILIGSLIAK
jgi:hypothetical protein